MNLENGLFQSNIKSILQEVVNSCGFAKTLRKIKTFGTIPFSPFSQTSLLFHCNGSNQIVTHHTFIFNKNIYMRILLILKESP